MLLKPEAAERMLLITGDVRASSIPISLCRSLIPYERRDCEGLRENPQSVSVPDMDTNASAPLSHAELVLSHQLRQWNASWLQRARGVRQESRGLRQHAHELCTHSQQLRQCYFRIECAWCKTLIRWQFMKDPVPVTRTSHSICPTCFATVTYELSLMSPCMPTTV